MEMTLRELVSKIGTRNDYLTAKMVQQYNPQFAVTLQGKVNKREVYISLPGLNHRSLFASDTVVYVSPLADSIEIAE